MHELILHQDNYQPRIHTYNGLEDFLTDSSSLPFSVYIFSLATCYCHIHVDLTPSMAAGDQSTLKYHLLQQSGCSDRTIWRFPFKKTGNPVLCDISLKTHSCGNGKEREKKKRTINSNWNHQQFQTNTWGTDVIWSWSLVSIECNIPKGVKGFFFIILESSFSSRRSNPVGVSLLIRTHNYIHS